MAIEAVDRALCELTAEEGGLNSDLIESLCDLNADGIKEPLLKQQGHLPPVIHLQIFFSGKGIYAYKWY